MQVDGASVVALSPVYAQTGPLDSVADRLERHLGWSVVVFDARSTLVANVDDPPAFVSLTSLASLAQPASGPAPSATLGVPPSGAAFVHAVDFDADGRWRVVFEMSSAGVATQARERWLVALLLGSAATVLVSALLALIVGSRQRALRLIDERTGELRRQALHDGLTGLPNRALILDRTERLLAACRRDKRLPAALYIDLDGFKLANDTLGHAAGDRPSPDDLLRDADIALYEAKASGKDRMAVFDPGMHETVRRRLETQTDLRTALESSELLLDFQPTFDLRRVAVTGVEALLRWNHPTRGIVAPLDFLPLAEETGLIVPIGKWVLEEACRHGAVWHAQGHQIRIAVNVSRRQLQQDDFVDSVREVLDRTGFEARFLVLEVNESTLMRDGASLVEQLRRLKALGLSIAVDDFGVGWSSLSYLKRFPVDSLKIDRSFIAAMTDSRESSALIHTLVQLGNDLGIETLAEGIEEHGQFNRLRLEECDSGQGFLFARPLAASAVTAFLDTWSQAEADDGDAHQPVEHDVHSQA